MQEARFRSALSLLGFASTESDGIGFFKYSGKLKTGKMLHGDSLFYESTRYPKPVSTQSHNSQKLLVSTRYTPEKSRGLHDIKPDIFKIVYHHP